MLNFVREGGLAAILAGVIVISTPSGESNFVFTDGVASHTTSDYSAQIGDIFADTGEHITVTPSGTNSATSNGETATITVVTN